MIKKGFVMKRLRFENGPLDATDTGILAALVEDGRKTVSELAKLVGLSAPSVSERMRRLEETGVIQGYQAVVDPAGMGLPLAVYIRIRPMPGDLRRVAQLVQDLEAIVECDRVTGEDCFIAKAHLRDVAELEALIDELIPYAITNTSVIQSSPVKRRLSPIADSLSRNGNGAEEAKRASRTR
jgi:Lrp/AsnC family leucine-responsive transcriptional regulator